MIMEQVVQCYHINNADIIGKQINFGLDLSDRIHMVMKYILTMKYIKITTFKIQLIF